MAVLRHLRRRDGGPAASASRRRLARATVAIEVARAVDDGHRARTRPDRRTSASIASRAATDSESGGLPARAPTARARPSARERPGRAPRRPRRSRRAACARSSGRAARSGRPRSSRHLAGEARRAAEHERRGARADDGEQPLVRRDERAASRRNHGLTVSGEDDRDERHRAGEREEDLCEGERAQITGHDPRPALRGRRTGAAALRRPARRDRGRCRRRWRTGCGCPACDGRRCLPRGGRRGAWRRSAARCRGLSVSSATVASPSRRRSRMRIRIGSPMTRKRRATSSTTGSGRGCGK